MSRYINNEIYYVLYEDYSYLIIILYDNNYNTLFHIDNMIENGTINNNKAENENKEDKSNNLNRNTSNIPMNIFDKKKLQQTNEIALDLPSGSINYNNNKTDYNPFMILEEINADIELLNNILNINSKRVIEDIELLQSPLPNKATQIEIRDLILPLTKMNKSVQISDKDDYLSLRNNINKQTEREL